ncbi:MAG: FAD:protein FMN transferase [Myxococcota bacterium]
MSGAAGPARARMRRARGLLAVLLVALAASGCGKPAGPAKPKDARVALSDGWLAMGTFFEADLRVRESELPIAKSWLAWARVELVRLEAVYSRHDAATQLSSLNRRLAQPVVLNQGAAIGPALESVLAESVRLWEATGGAFDVTVGPLVEVWRRAAEGDAWPSLESIREAKGRVGSDRLLLSGSGRLAVTASGVRIDLDAVSKGAALDVLADAFARALPDAAALITLGQSSTRAIGDPDGGGWVVAVRSTHPDGGELATLRLRDRAVSVSSSLGSTSEIAGQTVSHIIDPRTGSTVDGTVEAVVIGDRALRADGWSTGLLVLGAQRSSIRLVEKAGFEAYVFDSSGRTVSSAGWEAYLATGDAGADTGAAAR